MSRLSPAATTFPSQPGAIIFLTSYFWEGSALLKALLDADVGITHLVIQRPWWGRSLHRARMRFWYNAVRFGVRRGPRRYYGLERMARRHHLTVAYVDDVNVAALRWHRENITLIVVAGSRIIKPAAVARFAGKLINFHSGLLPYYRGPYSEFWAMHDNRPDLIGSSVHLIDEGIDTGPVLATTTAVLPPHELLTPQQAHHTNVLQAGTMVADAIIGYLHGDLKPTPQPPAGKTHTYPSIDELNRMSARLGRTFCVNFIE